MMRKQLLTLTLVVGVILITAPAQADWDPGDGHKMHWPQMPDPNGWDIDITRGFVADDWQCSESGPVNDIHFWMSWQGGNVGIVDGVWARIWSDVPANTDPLRPWSQPGELLWDHIFWDGFTVREPPGIGVQGWYTPAEWNDGVNPIINPNDHQEYYQVNIDDIASILEPFQQVKDTVYWLELHIIPEIPQTYAGWKTSLDKWNDDAVYEVMQNHNELIDPITGVSLDMAFVITPEPATLALLALGGLALIRRH
jgi:PEP-CTERM motif